MNETENVRELIFAATRKITMINGLLQIAMRMSVPNQLLVSVLVEHQLEGYEDLRALILIYNGAPTELLDRYDQLFFQLRLEHLLIAQRIHYRK